MNNLDRIEETDAEFRNRIEAEPLPRNFDALLENAIERFGDDPAWIFVEQDKPDLTWRELGELARRSANAFVEMGVRKTSHVGVMLPNIPENLAGWIALGLIGARIIPINPDYTPDELRYWLTDGDVEFLLITGKTLDTYLGVEKDTPLLSRERVAIWGDPIEGFGYWTRLLAEASSEFEPAENVGLDDVMNIQYTSGSTGRPKGCLLPQRYWIIFGKILSEMCPGLKRIQCDLPFYYMGPMWRFAMAAFTGGALCVPSSYKLSRFRERIRDNHYDMAWMTNAVAMLDADPIERDHNLKVILTFGMSPNLQSSVAARYKIPVRDVYGLTETGAAIGCRLNDNASVGIGTCGKVLPFWEAIITDAHGNALPAGETGELCIAGPSIMQGYYKKPTETQAAFRGKWFRTGDLARRNSDGYYFIVGRIKEMIRRSSENLSISEVEGAIVTLPEVQNVAVHGVDDEKRGEEVKVCLILKSGLTVDDLPPVRVLEHARAHLARFKVPRYIQYYRAFPLTASNKVARKLLREGAGEIQSEVYDASIGSWTATKPHTTRW